MTVVIAPSRCLRFLLAGFGASLLAAACAAGLATPPGFAAAPLVVAVLLFAGVQVLHTALLPAMAHRIDISGPVQLRLTVQQGVRQDTPCALPAKLLPGSTRWPRFLLLRLETGPQGKGEPAGEGGRARRVRRWPAVRAPACIEIAVLPDSLAPEAFRALAVALGIGDGAAGVRSTPPRTNTLNLLQRTNS